MITEKVIYIRKICWQGVTLYQSIMTLLPPLPSPPLFIILFSCRNLTFFRDAHPPTGLRQDQLGVYAVHGILRIPSTYTINFTLLPKFLSLYGKSHESWLKEIKESPSVYVTPSLILKHIFDRNVTCNYIASINHIGELQVNLLIASSSRCNYITCKLI